MKRLSRILLTPKKEYGLGLFAVGMLALVVRLPVAILADAGLVSKTVLYAFHWAAMVGWVIAVGGVINYVIWFGSRREHEKTLDQLKRKQPWER